MKRSEMKNLALKFLPMVIIALVFTFSASKAEKPQIGQPAPDFTLSDSHGTMHSLHDFKGKYIVLEWINFECPFVKKFYETQTMQKLQKEYAAKGVVWLSICSSYEGKQGYFKNEEINKRIKDHGAAMTAYLIDPDGAVGHLYYARTTPHIFIINPAGNLIYAGAIDNVKSADKEDLLIADNYVQVVLDAAMAGKPIKFPTSIPYGCSVKYKEEAPAKTPGK